MDESDLVPYVLYVGVLATFVTPLQCPEKVVNGLEAGRSRGGGENHADGAGSANALSLVETGASFL